MQQIWTQYHDQIIAALGFVAANILTPLIRKIPAANIVLVILRAILSGVPVEPAKEATKTDAKPPSDPPVGPLAAALFVGLLLPGCTMSLEQDRSAAAIRRATAPKYASRAECTTLDNIQRYWGYAGYATGPVGPAAGAIAAVPGVKDGAQNALLITAGVAAAVTVFEFAEQNNMTNQWVEQGCGQ